MSNVILELPTYKVLLRQLGRATRKSQNTFGDSSPRLEWEILFCDKTAILVSNVWVQGHIMKKPSEFQNDEDCVLLNDETGTCIAFGLSKIPKPEKPLKTGDFVMLAGHVMNAGRCLQVCSYNICCKVKAMKIINIASYLQSSSHKDWEEEVIETQSQVLQYTDDLRRIDNKNKF